MRTFMESGPFLDSLSKIVPVVLLVVVGALAVYSVVGVPVGLVLFGFALALAYWEIKTRHRD
jgi:hypothetical protein